MTEPVVYILLGPPGSGKGTQAIEFSKLKKIPHISTGDLFRENIGKQTELGKKAKSYINQGHLVPDELVLSMLFDRTKKEDCRNGFVLDGFPRTIPQAIALDEWLKGKFRTVALNLEVPDDSIVKRIEGVLTCTGCGNMHHRDFSPPKVSGLCDKCGSKLVQRPDDSKEIVLERLRVYHELTAPLVSHYNKQRVLKDIDGTKKPSEVLETLLRITL